MGTILKGKPVAEEIAARMQEDIAVLAKKGVTPTLLLIRVGNQADDVAYERSIVRNCEKNGIKALSDPIDAAADTAEVLAHIQRANTDKAIHGIMVFKPLPAGIDDGAVTAAIAPEKDIDCISERNIGRVFDGSAEIYPCTPQAVITLLAHYGIPLEGKNIAVVGRGMVVGKPLAMMLLKENATVTICHSKTQKLPQITKKADIVVAALGKARFLDKKYFSPNSIVIDVGVNFDEKEGKLVGDADFDGINVFVNAITPPTGGVGLVTTMTLLSHVVHCCKKLVQ